MKLTWSVLALALFGVAAAPAGKATPIGPAPIPTPLAGDSKAETWTMTIPEAIRIALDNSEIVGVLYAQLPPGTVTEQDRRYREHLLTYQPYYEVPICWDNPPRKAPIAGPLMIRAVKADTSPRQFRTEAMALVRSVEQQYWALAAQRVRVWCTEQAVRTCSDVLSRYAEAELTSRGRGTVSDIAEATEWLEQFQQDLKTQTSVLADDERRLRLILGLPESDGRRIVPTTRPIAEPLSFDWQSCLREVSQWQSDKVEERHETEKPNDRNPSIHRQTHALAACYSGADASYKQYEQATRLRTAATQRLEAQRTFLDAGRITIDRYLDAIRQHADAVAVEFQYATTYNTSLAALGEIKRTLLADRFILVMDQPLRMPKNWLAGYGQKDDQTQTTSIELSKTDGPKPSAATP